MLAATIIVLGVGLAVPGLASAAPPAPPPPPACAGIDELRYVDASVYFLKMNSCSARNFAENLDDGQKAAGVIAGLGAKSPEVGIVSAALSAGLWYNQDTIEECVAAAPGRGISFGVASGIVVGCKPQ